jgi:hypothetical protein
MIERAYTFGRNGALTGIVTEPAAESRRPEMPTFVLWNVGFNHHIGPFRSFVDLARRLAALGFEVLRFDVSGLGDSEQRADAVGDLQRAAGDVQEAMDFLEQRSGTRRFALVGFCSSVDAAYAVTMRDPRVVAVAYLEGYSYQSNGFWLHYARRFLNPVRWERLLGAHLPSLFPRARTWRRTRGRSGEIYRREYPTQERFADDLYTLVERGVRVLAVYMGGDTEFNHDEQFYEMFGDRLRGRIAMQYYDEADHICFRVPDRERLLQRVCGWAKQELIPASAEAVSRISA